MSRDRPVMTIALSTISWEPRTQMRSVLNPDSLAEYTETYCTAPHLMPPVDVFDLIDQDMRRVLGDGHTRRTAAERAGLKALPARLHQGTLADAQRFAIQANSIATHGRPLAKGDWPTAVHNLRMAQPAITVEQIAQQLSCSVRTALDIVRADEVRDAARAAGITLDLPYTHRENIGRAPREHWAALARATISRDWTREEIRLAAKNLNAKGTPKDHRDRLLAGEDDPKIFGANGQALYHSNTLARRLAKAEKHVNDQKKKRHSLRCLEMERDFDKMHEWGLHAIQGGEDVAFTDEERQHLGYSLTQVRRLVDLLDDMIMGRRTTTWQEQLRVIKGGVAS